MNCFDEYKKKLVSPEEAVKVVKSGDWIDYNCCVCFPALLDEALAKRKDELFDVKIRGNLLFGPIKAVEGDEGSTEGKKIAVTIDLGKDQLAQSVLKKNVSAGKLLLAGKKPSNYDFHIGSQVFGASGLEVKITGETVLYFDMDADYEINEADLVIEE